MPYPFDCRRWNGRNWEEASVMYDEAYDDSVGHHCYDELQVGRGEIEKGDV